MPTLEKSSNGIYWYPTAAVPALVTYLRGKSVTERPDDAGGKYGDLGPAGAGPNAVDWINNQIGGFPGGPQHMPPIQIVVPADMVEGGSNQTVHIVSIADDKSNTIDVAASTPQFGIVMSSTFMKAPDNPVSAWANAPDTGLPHEGTDWTAMLFGVGIVAAVTYGVYRLVK